MQVHEHARIMEEEVRGRYQANGKARILVDIIDAFQRYWRYFHNSMEMSSKERLKSGMNLCKELVKNHEKENGYMHSFECKRDGSWEESISSGIEPWVAFLGGGSITWNCVGKSKISIKWF